MDGTFNVLRSESVSKQVGLLVAPSSLVHHELHELSLEILWSNVKIGSILWIL